MRIVTVLGVTVSRDPIRASPLIEGNRKLHVAAFVR